MEVIKETNTGSLHQKHNRHNLKQKWFQNLIRKYFSPMRAIRSGIGRLCRLHLRRGSSRKIPEQLILISQVALLWVEWWFKDLLRPLPTWIIQWIYFMILQTCFKTTTSYGFSDLFYHESISSFSTCLIAHKRCWNRILTLILHFAKENLEYTVS